MFLYSFEIHDKLVGVAENRSSNAVTTDSSNALFIVSDHEEEKLAIKGRLIKENNLL
jgi:hypothetical protein